MTIVRFHDEARLEFLNSVAYYETIQVGLGERFRQSVEAALALATSFPSSGSPHNNGTRRVFPKKFPFAIVYLVAEHEIIVFAIAHYKRKPGYWRSRQRES